MKDIYHKYGPLITVLLLFYVSILIFKPFFVPIVSAAIIAYIFYPLYGLIKKKFSPTLSAIITVTLVGLILVIPLWVLSSKLVEDLPTVYTSVSKALQQTDWLNNIVETVSQDFGIDLNLRTIVTSMFNTLFKYLQNIVAALPGQILHVIFGAFFLFFFFKDGYEMLDKLGEILPFGRAKTLILFNEIKNVTDAVVYGQLVTATIQGILAWIAYMIAGVNGPFFWAMVTFFCALIPMIGPAIIYAPISISMIVTGINDPNVSALKGILLLAFSLGIISSVDNIVKPRVISGKVKMHPAVVAVSMIGGLSVFGFMGLLLGPIIIISLLTLFQVYEMKGLL